MNKTVIAKLRYRQFMEVDIHENTYTFLLFSDNELSGMLNIKNNKVGYCNGSKQVNFVKEGNLIYFYWDFVPMKGIQKEYVIYGETYNFVIFKRQKGFPKAIKQKIKSLSH